LFPAELQTAKTGFKKVSAVKEENARVDRGAVAVERDSYGRLAQSSPIIFENTLPANAPFFFPRQIKIQGQD
jgi:hypothetical protein